MLFIYFLLGVSPSSTAWQNLRLHHKWTNLGF